MLDQFREPELVRSVHCATASSKVQRFTAAVELISRYTTSAQARTLATHHATRPCDRVKFFWSLESIISTSAFGSAVKTKIYISGSFISFLKKQTLTQDLRCGFSLFRLAERLFGEVDDWRGIVWRYNRLDQLGGLCCKLFGPTFSQFQRGAPESRPPFVVGLWGHEIS
jgi:hypothetical protein